MTTINTTEELRTKQYGDGTNLNARIAIHQRFGIGAEPWQNWLFGQIDAPPVCRILELGCGTGQFWLDNQDRIPAGWQITLSDFSEGMLRDAKNQLATVHHAFDYQVIDAQDIPLDDGSFDIVMANFMLYHVPDRPKAFAEIRRVLKSSGTFYAATNGIDHMREIKDLEEKFGFTRVASMRHLPFRLENSGEQLSAFFENVRLLRLEDGLRVTESQPVIDYLLSMRDEMPSEGQIDAMRAYLDGIISSEGAFSVQKASGVFVASNT
jgi:ubiquinone/menaquinone biosynthesis C-methylase UbiE